MKSYSWEEYYDSFFGWAESTQVRNLSYLTSLGDADEVAEIINALSFSTAAGNRLLKRAVEEKLKFKVSDLIEFSYCYDEALVAEAVRISSECLSEADISELCGIVSDELIKEICKKKNYKLPDYLIWNTVEPSYEAPRPKKPGFFATLLGVMAVAGETESSSKGHNGKCNGDCAHCPPHYGYRYGRWYYGHSHSYGCEFGGNKGDGRD